MPLDLLKEEQAQLTAELERIERQLDVYRADVTATRRVMEAVLDLMQDCSRLYSAAPAHLKKLLNQVFFERILVNPRVDDDGAVIVPGTSPSQSDSSNAADDVGQVSDQAERQHTDVASPCMSDELVAWSVVPEDGGDGDMTTERAAMVCPPLPLSRMTSGSNGTTLTACLRFPFTYLASPALRRAAERDAIGLNKQKTGAQPHQQNTPIPANKHSPRHNLPHEAVPLGCCSYTRVLVRLREINENKLETLLALRADVLARAGERLADEDASQALAQATPSTAHQSPCDEAPKEGTTLANQTAEPVDTGARQHPAPSPHSVTGDSLKLSASGDSEPPSNNGLAEPAHNPIRAKTDANAVAHTIVQHQHHLTAAERDEVARLYQDGLPVRTICERFGISKDVVYGIRRRRGLPRRRAGMTDEQKAQVVELRARGVSAAAIGRQFGVNVKTVLAYLRAADSDQTRR